MTDQTPMPDAFQQATMSQLTGVLKLLIMSGGTYLVQKGILDQGSLGELAAGLAGLLVAIGWMLWSRRLTGVVKSASNALGDTGVIIAPPNVADKLPANVVSSVAEASRVPGIPQL